MITRQQRQLTCFLLFASAMLCFQPEMGFAQPRPVGTADLGCGVIIMSSGDLYVAGFEGPQACPRPQRPWVLLANLFTSSGSAMGSVVGLNQHGQVLASNGDWFQLTIDYNGCNAISAAFQGNVFQITGVPAAAEQFVTFGGGSPVGGYEYAATNYGNIFRWAGCSGWELVGTLSGAPTGSPRVTWSRVKATYR